MKELQFEGYSDDTFGERTTREDYDNCASGEPIIFKVWSATANDGIYVVGHYCPGPLTGWMIGVGRLNEDDYCHMPKWPMRFVADYVNGRPYSPILVVEVPDDATVEHFTDPEDAEA